MRKPRERDSTNFTGLSITNHEDEYIIHQKEYISRLKPLNAFSNFSNFQSLRTQLAWAKNSKPNIVCHVVILKQVTNDLFSANKKYFFKLINAVLSHLKKYLNLELKFPKLEKDLLRSTVYSNASITKNWDKTSQLGYFVILKVKLDNFQSL